jgi:hypothetical protein
MRAQSELCCDRAPIQSQKRTNTAGAGASQYATTGNALTRRPTETYQERMGTRTTAWMDFDALLGSAYPTLGNLMDYIVIAGKCEACSHIQEIDRWELLKRYGGDQVISQLRKKLKCRRCGNRKGNFIVCSKMAR